MSNFTENYKEQVVHIVGGINEYVGELVAGQHKNGAGWVRLKNPCLVQYLNQANGARMIRLMSLYNSGSMYKQYIDIRIPEESLMEIMTLLKDGELMKNYIKETTREKSSIIIPTGDLKLN